MSEIEIADRKIPTGPPLASVAVERMESDMQFDRWLAAIRDLTAVNGVHGADIGVHGVPLEVFENYDTVVGLRVNHWQDTGERYFSGKLIYGRFTIQMFSVHFKIEVAGEEVTS